jgi:hypothetical protein
MKPVPPANSVSLKARLYRITLIHWVDIPHREVAKLRLPPAETKGAAKGWYALLRFNDDLDRVTLLPGKRGHYKLAIKVELLRAAGAKAGDTIAFVLSPDSASREPELPAEMAKAFQARPQLAERWLEHSVALRRQLVRYIIQAKSPEAQARRCWIFIERLAETGKLSSA